jgi:RNA polymerase sigma-70 factor (ECF subfamily)
MLTEDHLRFGVDYRHFSVARFKAASEMGRPAADSVPDSGPHDASCGEPPTDSELFLQLSTPHIPVVRGLLRSMLHNDANVEDAFQETLLQAFSKWHQLRKRESFRPWLIQIAMNEARKILRCKPCWLARHAVDQPLHDGERFLEETPDSRESPSELLEHAEIRTLLKRTIAKLPTRERDVLVLCDIGGATSPVAAKMLRVSKARVRSMLHRARAKLREELGPILEPIAYKRVMRESDATLDSALIQ